MPSLPDPNPRPLDHLSEYGTDDDPALSLRDRTLSFKELRSRVGRLAAWLSSQVDEPGARIAGWMAKGELACLLPLAAARAGLVYVPINPLLKQAQADYILADCDARLLIATRSRANLLENNRTISAYKVTYEELVAQELEDAEASLPPSDRAPDELCALLYTSGSTGKPKGVMLSHANLWLGAVSVAQYLGMADDDVTLAVLPLSFDYGQNQLLSTWFAGGCVVPLDFLFPRDVVKVCARHKVTTLAAVPPLWIQLTEIEWGQEAVTSMRRLTNSGGALTKDLVHDLRTVFPDAQLFPMYGLTEAFRSTYLDPDLVDKHPTSMGKAIPFAEVLVIADDGEPAEVGEEGELVHCGPLVAQGYWQDAERTAERFRTAPAISEYGGIAVWSGDRVRRDEEGLLYFVGRRDSMIKSAGNRISPQEVEEAALATGLVVQAVALGVSDERLGQAVHLIVRAEAGAENPHTALPQALTRELPNFMQPKKIHWRESFPLNPNGKIDRVTLAQEIAA